MKSEPILANVRFLYRLKTSANQRCVYGGTECQNKIFTRRKIGVNIISPDSKIDQISQIVIFEMI